MQILYKLDNVNLAPEVYHIPDINQAPCLHHIPDLNKLHPDVNLTPDTKYHVFIWSQIPKYQVNLTNAPEKNSLCQM